MTDPKIPGPQDEATRLEASSTQTATYNTAALDLGNGFAPGGIGEPVAVVANVTAIKTSAGDETYTHKLQESADAAAWTDAGVAVAMTAVGTSVAKGFITKRYVRRAVTIAGTAPTITNDALLNRNVGF